MIPPLSDFPLNWLAAAEISHAPAQAAKVGLSFFFTDDVEYERFCRVAKLPADAVARAAALSGRFDLVPRHWVKLHYENGQRCGLSQYFVLDPRHTYPIASLRLSLKQCGLIHSRGIEPVFEPALERSDTLWAVIAKQSDDGVRARISCRLPRALLGELFSRMVRQGYVSELLAAGYRKWDDALEAGEYVYLSLDPDVPDSCAVDYEKVAAASVPQSCKAFWFGGEEGDGRRYLKCRLHPRCGEPEWIVYRPLAGVLATEDLERRCGPADAHRRRVRSYYDAFDETILRDVGPTYQAGLFEKIEPRTAATSNRCLAERAELGPGQRLLDAGCGTCGPSVDVCRVIPDLRIDAVTISQRQGETATRLVREARLEDRIRVHVADYHALPFGAAAFDRVWFLESIGYSDDRGGLCAEVFRVLRPGGSVYIKDVFRRDGELAAAERLELAEFDRVYVQRTPSVGEIVAALRTAGFGDVQVADLSEQVSMQSFNRAMIRGRRLCPEELTEFGRHHYRSFRRLPVAFAEIRAVRG